ncbi:MAG: hypothetical protein Q4Q17_05665 [Tissierellia bacterium]|nr:hypothetical protein [Tissierellia bacterium]
MKGNFYKTKKIKGFLLFELLVALFLISVFFIAFIPAFRNTKAHKENLKQYQHFNRQCHTWIENCIGNHTIMEYDGNMNMEPKVIFESESYLDVEVTFSSLDGSFKKNYEFTIEKKNP